MRMNYDTIASEAEDVLRDVYGDLSNIEPPINLVEIAEKYGLQVYRTRFDKHPAVSGAYDRQKKSIYVSEDDSQARRNFTIAHELGHFFLHQDRSNEVFLRTDAFNLHQDKPPEEKEADVFASVILMPAGLVYKYWQLENNPEELAIIFGVSESAMRWRLHNLKLINNYEPSLV